LNKLWQHKVIRFGCVGVVGTLTDLTLLNIFVFGFGLNILVGNLFSASISITMSYFLNHAIVFRREYEISLRLFLKFITITGLSILVVQTVVIYSFEHIFTIARLHAMFGNELSSVRTRFLQVNGAKATAVLFGMTWNFVLYHFVVFRHPKEAPDIDEEGIVPY
ncbi:MAG TPA: GtrA family protein, partial [Candidatus Dormibacteraeota bacterium]|nr:GtrA family protein [Candidatus Dormibacteraeota bacterium]